MSGHYLRRAMLSRDIIKKFIKSQSHIGMKILHPIELHILTRQLYNVDTICLQGMLQ